MFLVSKLLNLGFEKAKSFGNNGRETGRKLF